MYALSTNELDDVSAGVTWQQVSVGIGLVALGVSIAATGGLAGIGVGIILGAGFGGEIGLAAAALGLAGAGGTTIGFGMAN